MNSPRIEGSTSFETTPGNATRNLSNNESSTKKASDQQNVEFSKTLTDAESSTKKASDPQESLVSVGLSKTIGEFVRGVMTAALAGARERDAGNLEEEDLEWIASVVRALEADERIRSRFVRGHDIDDEPVQTPASPAAAAPAILGNFTSELRDIARAYRTDEPSRSAVEKSALEAASTVQKHLAETLESTQDSTAGAGAGAGADTTDRRDRRAVIGSESTPVAIPRHDVQATSEDALEANGSEVVSHTEEGDFPDVDLERIMLGTAQRFGVDALTDLRRAIERDVPSPQLERMLTAFDRLRSTIEMSARRNAQDLADIGTGAIAGGFEEVALEGSTKLANHQGDPKYSLQYTLSRIAPTIARLEKEDSDVSSEQMVDLVVHWYAGEPVYVNGRRPNATPEFREVLNRFRAMLLESVRTQAGEARPVRLDLGLLETITNVITWFGMAIGDKSEEAACERCASMFALETLEYYMRATGDTARLGRMLSQVANNVAGWMSDALGLKRNEDRVASEIVQKLNLLHSLGTVAHLMQRHSGNWNNPAHQLFGAMGIEQGKGFQLPPEDAVPEGDGKHARIAAHTLTEDNQWTYAARSLLFMSNVPSAWRELCGVFSEERNSRPVVYANANADARFRTAVLAALSAVIRAQFNPPQDAHEVSSALFNLGVDVLAIRRNEEGISGSSSLRAIANGLGMVWAFNQGRDDRTAMEPLNGADCAVNFCGAFADLEMRNDFTIERSNITLIRSIIESTISECQRQGLAQDVFRLRGSFRTIFSQNEEPRLDARFSQTQVRRWCIELIYNLLKRSPISHEVPELTESADALERSLGTETFAVTCARALRWGFASLGTENRYEGTPSAFETVGSWWVRITLRMARLSQDGGFSAYQGQINPDLRTWGIEEPAERYEGPLHRNLLSRTLADPLLMAPFFGVKESERRGGETV